jgi:hypothetical protein
MEKSEINEERFARRAVCAFGTSGTSDPHAYPVILRWWLYAYLGYPVIPRLARMLAREVDGTDFRPSRNGDETEPVASHSLRGCRGAMVQRGRLYAYLGFPVAPMHVGVGWM